ncbi:MULTISPECIES: hypothetical protein [Runella]|uniref:Uncharacterized protein YbbK (DUF523 family) n=1 Tax=Runella defluvii TaxID=370973 RepID=A0A7W6EQG0_9BACT|nr:MULTISPECIES: hypothetical protein [Runella]MBB3838574.1 uncharacterized protein YbbK (DUF523 family) [Runella defluvii]
MKTNISKETTVRKSNEQVVEEKLKAANTFLKKADLSIVRKAMLKEKMP